MAANGIKEGKTIVISEQRVWGYIGAFCALCTTVFGLIGVYYKLQSLPSIGIKAYAGDVNLPTEWTLTARESKAVAIASTNYFDRNQVLWKSKTGEKWSQETYETIKTNVEPISKTMAEFIDKMYFEIDRYHAYYFVQVENNGQTTAPDCALLFRNESGWYETKGGEGTTSHGNWSEKIPIGDLKPGRFSTLRFWTTSLSSAYDKDKIKIAFEGGVLPLNFVTSESDVSGQPKIGFPGVSLLIAFVSVMGLIVSVVGYSSSRKAGKKSMSDGESSNSSSKNENLKAHDSSREENPSQGNPS